MPKNEAAVSLGKLGGAARAKNLSPERRKEIAAMGAAKREANKLGRKSLTEEKQ